MSFSPNAHWIGWLLALLCLLAAYRNGRRRWLIEKLPTTKTNSGLTGLVEVKGTAELHGPPLCSYLTHQPCLHYKWIVEEKWSCLTMEDGSLSRERGWQKVDEGEERVPFRLKDDQGSLLVRPDGAKIEPVVLLDKVCKRNDPLYYGKGPAKAVSHSKHERRFYEIGIPVHQELCVIGHAQQHHHSGVPEIANDKRASLFLISTWTEEEVRKRWRGRSVKWIFGGLAALLGGLLVRDMQALQLVDESWPTYVIHVSVYLFVAMLVRALMISSARIDLANGVEQMRS